ncbi:MAG: hypothetical protein SGCHY_003283 [Lobulomycetales sp.]
MDIVQDTMTGTTLEVCTSGFDSKSRASISSSSTSVCSTSSSNAPSRVDSALVKDSPLFGKAFSLAPFSMAPEATGLEAHFPGRWASLKQVPKQTPGAEALLAPTGKHVRLQSCPACPEDPDEPELLLPSVSMNDTRDSIRFSYIVGSEADACSIASRHDEGEQRNYSMKDTEVPSDSPSVSGSSTASSISSCSGPRTFKLKRKTPQKLALDVVSSTPKLLPIAMKASPPCLSDTQSIADTSSSVTIQCFGSESPRAFSSDESRCDAKASKKSPAKVKKKVTWGGIDFGTLETQYSPAHHEEARHEDLFLIPRGILSRLFH